jgi:hypothetical protein
MLFETDNFILKHKCTGNNFKALFLKRDCLAFSVTVHCIFIVEDIAVDMAPFPEAIAFFWNTKLV